MNRENTYLIVDDDPVNNFLCRETILASKIKKNNIIDFTSPELALSFLQNEVNISQNFRFIVILDIKMPQLNGWEFLDKFETLSENIKQKVEIYILTTSIDPRDKERANHRSYIKDFIIKPISTEYIESKFAHY